MAKRAFTAELVNMVAAYEMDEKELKLAKISLEDRISTGETLDDTMSVLGKKKLRVIVDAIGIFDCHNENAKKEDRKDYRVAVFNAIFKDGTDADISTGSKSFLEDCERLADNLADLGETGYKYMELDIVAKPSKNYAGRNFYKIVFHGLVPAGKDAIEYPIEVENEEG